MKRIQRTLLAAFLLAAGAAFADGIAFITNLKGEVAVDGVPRPTLLAELSRGQKLTIGRDSQASVMYTATGKEYVLRGPADYVVEAAAISGSIAPITRDTEWRASSKALVQVAQSSAASVRMRSAAPPKADMTPKMLFPDGGTVSTLQPTFRWDAAEPKQRAEFTLLVVGEDKPVHQGKATGGSYRLPAKLKPETEYAWTVTSAGNEIGAGRFRTLSSEAQQRVEQRRPSDRAEFSDRVLFALMLQEMGAKQEARESWARLAQERTDLPELGALAR